MTPDDARLTSWFEDHRSFLWGLSYRVTGSAADADDVVQETFIKALEHPPKDLAEPRPWLVRVAVNTARDVLRRRRRRGYIGPWLPDPIESDGPTVASFEPAVDGAQTLEGRYDLMESVSMAFLQALEALTPTQRAVLLLTDVFDYSAAEVASALGLSAGNVRIIHHRARRSMQEYDRGRATAGAEAREQRTVALRRFLNLLADNDVGGIERMLASDVRAVADGGGIVTATVRPIVGRVRVARLFAALRQSRQGRVHARPATINGAPAIVLDFSVPLGRRPSRLVLTADLNERGEIARIWVVANPRKLRALRDSEPASAAR